jgi:hypothetical protein
MLTNDLNAGGFAQPIKRKNGMAVPAGVARASDQQVEGKTPYGTVPIAWTDIAPESIIAMAQSFIRPGMPDELAADRKWHLGVFLFLVGKAREGRALLAEAASMQPVHQTALPLFLEFAEK